ncbi:MAG: hypothetical protein ABH877_01500 [bacterium]
MSIDHIDATIRATSTLVAVIVASCGCEREYPTCNGEQEIIVRFSNETAEADNLAVIGELDDTVLRHDPEIHYFLLRTSRCAEDALGPYWDRGDVDYAIYNFCVFLAGAIEAHGHRERPRPSPVGSCCLTARRRPRCIRSGQRRR